jgi:membrane protein
MRRKVSTAFPTKWLIRTSKIIYLPGLKGISIYDIIRFFFHQVRKVGLLERTSAISFNFVMAIPPMIIFLCTLLPYLPISKEIIQQLYALIRDVVPGEKNNSAIIKFINDFLRKPRTGLLSIGLLIALFYSSNAMMGIMRAFDKNYVGFRIRSPFQRRKTAIKLTLILFFFMFASLVILIMQGSVLKLFGVQNVAIRTTISNVRWVIIILLFLISNSIIYRNAAFESKRWSLINPGSVLSTGLMVLFTFLFSYWVNNFGNFNKLYGSIGTIMILMLLIYFNAMVLLIGFELNVSISTLRHEAEERKKMPANGLRNA